MSNQWGTDPGQPGQNPDYPFKKPFYVDATGQAQRWADAAESEGVQPDHEWRTGEPPTEDMSAAAYAQGLRPTGQPTVTQDRMRWSDAAAPWRVVKWLAGVFVIVVIVFILVALVAGMIAGMGRAL